MFYSKIGLGDFMQNFNLKDEVKKILVEFLNINKKDPMELMTWFYKAIPFNLMFEEKLIADFITTSLEENEYYTKGIKNELPLYQHLIAKEDTTKEEIASALICFSLAYIKESCSLDQALICYIRHFNEEYNHDFTMKYMESNLSLHMGEEVVYTIVENGEYAIKTGTLLSLGNQVVEIGDCLVQYSELCEIHTQSGFVLFHQEQTLDQKSEKSSEKNEDSGYNTDIGMLM